MVTFLDNIDDNFEDTEVINVCNEFNYQYNLQVRKIHTRKRNWKKIKQDKPSEWVSYERLNSLCKDNGINYREYIKFCIDTISQERKYINATHLINIKYVRLFGEWKQINKQYIDANHNIIKSFKNIREICKNHNITDFKGFIKYLILNKNLASYMKSGTISILFLSLIPNIQELIKLFDTNSQLELQQYLFNKYEYIRDLAITSLEKNNNHEYINVVKRINSFVQEQ